MFEPVDEDDFVMPLTPEGIPIDMIGHYPSDGPTHEVRMPRVDETYLEFDSADQFISAFDMHASMGHRFIVVFLGSKVPGTNNSWCPHCTQSMPKIERVIEAAKGKRVVITGNVSMNAWKGTGS